MFLHLGNNVIISKKDIITILTIEEKIGVINKFFLKKASSDGILKSISKKKVSCIITVKKIYLSHISCDTLKKRANIKF
ncbi:MAG: DUF370 domain-containing protein [Desulfotomaculum sp.]|nr:DUF370 domain-containing protein [Desulfotomaculum sp.]